MNKVFCRIFQAGMKLGMYFLPWTTPEIMDGENSSRDLTSDIKRRGADRILIVTGPNMVKRGLMLPMLKEMKANGIEYRIFDSLTADPTDVQVEAGVMMYRELDAQGIVLFGGGSPMDCGKAIAARIAKPTKSVAKLQGTLRIHSRKRVPTIWAIPTTSGTGSEATMAAVITSHETHRKKSINDVSIIPHVCVLDATLTAGLPPAITADTGMDALCHAVEAYTNATYNTTTENDMARDAVKLIYDNLYRAYAKGTDLEARRNMQRAALCAGRAFTRGCVGYVHALGHGIGGLYGVPHGKAMAVLLPPVLRAYGDAVYSRLSELADVCGITCSYEMYDGLAAPSSCELYGGLEAPNSCELSMRDGLAEARDMSDSHNAELPLHYAGYDPAAIRKSKAEAFIRWIENLNEKMGIEKGFDCIKEGDILTIAEWADSEANPLYPVPKIFNKRELAAVVKEIMKAEPKLTI